MSTSRSTIPTSCAEVMPASVLSESCAEVDDFWVKSSICDCPCGCDDYNNHTLSCQEHYLVNKIYWIETEFAPSYQKAIMRKTIEVATVPIENADTILPVVYGLGRLILGWTLGGVAHVRPDPIYPILQIAGRNVSTWVDNFKKEINDVTHDAVEIEFICIKCHQKFYATYQINDGGKHANYGGYATKRVRTSAFNFGRLPIRFVVDKFDEMPGEYNVLSNNCKIWSRRFISSLIGYDSAYGNPYHWTIGDDYRR
ncbi:hypothetical protein Ddc_14520 [Ditylenchus destructor]|nr:hypothetical protein Ddc_14520 [Ditylenchus destructor]